MFARKLLALGRTPRIQLQVSTRLLKYFKRNSLPVLQSKLSIVISHAAKAHAVKLHGSQGQSTEKRKLLCLGVQEAERQNYEILLNARHRQIIAAL